MTPYRERREAGEYEPKGESETAPKKRRGRPPKSRTTVPVPEPIEPDAEKNDDE